MEVEHGKGPWDSEVLEGANGVHLEVGDGQDVWDNEVQGVNAVHPEVGEVEAVAVENHRRAHYLMKPWNPLKEVQNLQGDVLDPLSSYP